MNEVLLRPNRNYLLSKWRKVLEETRHIVTWTSESELAWLAEYASTREHIIEIGSHRGRSAKVMLLANPKLYLWTLDTWDDVGIHEEYVHNLGPEIFASRVHYTKGPSHAALAALHHTEHPFDGAFVDGGHLEPDVAGDIEGVCRIMPGAFICGHDYRTDPNDGVNRAVIRLLPQHVNPLDSLWAAQL